MKDLGPLRYFLGIEIARTKQGIYLCQWKYTLDILYDAGFLGVKLLSLSMKQNHQLGKAKRHLLPRPNSYRRLMSHLIFLIFTRPDLAYFVQVLSQFIYQPRQDHWDAALHVLRYIKSTPSQGLFLRADSDLQL